MEIFNDIAIIFPLEKNKKVLQPDGKMKNIYYEYEALRFIQSFRKNGGLIRNNPMWCLINENSKPSQEIIDNITKYSVNIVRTTYDVKNDIPFLPIPYTGYFFENNDIIKQNFRIQMDLDFIIYKQFDLKMITYENLEKSTIIGVDNSINTAENPKAITRNTYDNTVFDTSMIISNKKLKFYSLFYKLLTSNIFEVNDQWKLIQEKFGKNNYYFKDEFIIDYINKNNLHSIKKYFMSEYEWGYQNSSKDSFIKHDHLTSLEVMNYKKTQQFEI